MRMSFCLLFCFFFKTGWSYEKPDSLKSKLKADATISVNSNGIASIPAFSLGEPAIIASISLGKGRFSYDPTLAYGLDLKPWFIDNWLHYKIIRRSEFELRAGFNISSFFSDYKLPDNTILQSERYFAFALAAIFKITPKTSFTLDYWNDRGQEEGSIKGHFIDLMIERSDINLGKNVVLYGNIMLFYINYDGDNDGLFVSPKISASVRDLPFSLYFQTTQPIFTNVSPFPGFKWNIGVAYTL